MKSYLPAAVLGTALTAAAFGFGAATVHAAEFIDESARQVVTSLPAMGYSSATDGVTSGAVAQRMVTDVDGLMTGQADGAVERRQPQ